MKRHRLQPSPRVIELESREAPAVINFLTVEGSSTMSLSGSVTYIVTLNLQAQQTTPVNSLNTKFYGTSRVDVDFTNNTITSIATGTQAIARNSGVWQPAIGGAAGSDSANFGGKISIPFSTTYMMAVRDTIATMESGPLILSGAGTAKTYPSTQKLTMTAGTVDYRGNDDPPTTGSESLINNFATNAAAGNSTFTDNGNGTYLLSVPVDVTINTTIMINPTTTAPAKFTLKGKLEANAVLPVVDLNGAGAGTNVTFTPAGPTPVAIAPVATLALNSASAVMDHVTIRLESAPDGAAEGLAVDLTGTGLNTSGYNSVTGELIISGVGTVAAYQSAIQKVTYANAASSPTAGLRSVTVIATDVIHDPSSGDVFNDSLPRTASGDVVDAPAHVQSVLINDGQTQRSMVKAVSVTFDKLVSFNGSVASAFQLTGPGGAVALSADTSGSSATNTTVRLTFSGAGIVNGSLADGRYTLTVLADNGAVGVVNFDGDNNGSAGGNYVLSPGSLPDPPTNIFRIYGDATGDGTVAANDFITFRQFFNGSSDMFDYDGDSSVSASDFVQFRLRFNGSI